VLKQLALATFAATAFVAATLSNANASGCPTWMCGSNGTQLTGIALPPEFGPPTLIHIVLPAGEIIDSR
jgi:hypothetical protein